MRRPPRRVVVLGGVAGQGQEHLVEAGLAERELGDGDAGARASAASASDARSASVDRDATARPGRTRGARPRRARARARARPSARWSGSSRRTCSVPAPTDALSSPRRALGDHPAVVDDRDPVGELVGLVEVLRGQQHRRALGDERADDVPHLVAPARVEAGRRLVEEQQLRGDDDARGDVEPPAHAARVVLDLSGSAASASPNASSSSAARSLARARGRSRAAGRAAPGSRGRSGPRRPTRTGRSGSPSPRTASASATMSWPSTRALPASGRSSVASMRIVVVLPAPFGPSTP